MSIATVEPAVRADRGPASQDLRGLSWCAGEIRETLEAVDGLLERYRETGEDLSLIESAAAQIHQVHGALRMIDVAGPDQLCAEIEGLLGKVQAGELRLDAATATAVSAAMAAISEYLDEQLRGAPSQPLYLFPYLRDLLLCRAAERIHPADLFFPKSGRLAIARQSLAELSAQDAASVRALFEQGVLRLLRAPSDGSSAREMIVAIDRVARSPLAREQQTFWALCAVYFRAIAEGRANVDVLAKRLLARLNLQIRRTLADGAPVSDRLQRDLLFSIACLEPATDELRRVFDVFGLHGMVPGQFETPRYGATDRRTMRALTESVTALKRAWEAMLQSPGGVDSHMGEFKHALARYQDAADELDPDGLGRLTGAWIGVAKGMGLDAGPVSEGLGVEVATSLLFVEQLLEAGLADFADREARCAEISRRIDACLMGHGADERPPAWLLELSSQVQERLTTRAFVTETHASLLEAEAALDAWLRRPEEGVDGLGAAVRQMDAVSGVMTLLGHQAAATAASSIAATARSIMECGSLDERSCSMLAENVGNLGFFVDALGSAESLLTEFHFDPAAGVLRRVGQGGSDLLAAAPTAVAAPPAEVSLESRLETELQALDAMLEQLGRGQGDPAEAAQTLARIQDIAQLADDPEQADAAQVAQLLLEENGGGAAAQVARLLNRQIDSLAAAAPPAEPLPEAAAEIDAELLGIFLDEAVEVLESIAEAQARLAITTSDQAALTSVRRGFHTLKGSSRMVGLDAFGETAWALEQLLNHWLAEEGAASPSLLELIEQARGEFADWVAALGPAGDAAAGRDGLALIARADALRLGRPLEASVPAVPAVTEDAAAPEVAGDAAAPEVAGNAVAPEVAEHGHPPAAVEDAPAGADSVDPEASETVGMDSPQAAGEVSEPWFTLDPEALAELSAPAESDSPPEPWSTAESWSSSGFGTPAETMGTADSAAPLLPPASDDPEFSFGFELPAEPASGPASSDESATRSDAAGDPEPGLADDVSYEALAALVVEEAAQYPEPDAAVAFEVIGSADANDGIPDPADEAVYREEGEPFGQAALHEEEAASRGDEAAVREDEVVIVDGRRIDASLFQVFAAEVDDLQTALLQDARDWQQNPQRRASETAQRGLHSLKGSAALVGAEAQSVLARAIESFLTAQAASGRAVGPEDLASYGMLLQTLIGSLRQIARREPAQSIEAVIPVAEALGVKWRDLRSEGEVGSTPAVGVVRPAETEAPELRDELDPELLQLFIEEAAEYLPQIDGNLRDWLGRPDDKALQQLVMRQLHTVKGSARMAGVMVLGQQVHEMESRVEAAMDEAAIDPTLIEELLTELDDVTEQFERLMALAEGGGLPQAIDVEPVAPVAGPAPRTTDPAGAGAPAAAAIHAESAADAEQDGAATAFVERRAQPRPEPIVPPEPDLTDVTAAAAGDSGHESPAASTAPEPLVSDTPAAVPGLAPAPEPARNQSLVRVRSDLLDTLVNESGEASIARSRLDSAIGQVRASMGELAENVNRLRQHLREIEMHAETRIQANREPDPASRGPDGFDPLEFDRFTRFQELARMLAESVNDVATVQQNAARSLDEAVSDLNRQGMTLRQLQHDLLSVRMVQFGTINDRLYRVVRQSAKALGKRVSLDVRGAGVNTDRGVLERMVAPLEHLLRNAIAHGIEAPGDRLAAGKGEAGEIVVLVQQNGNEVVITLSDDGAGLNLERIRARAIERGLLREGVPISDEALADLIFRPGFSTAAGVDQISGRGVGMDVVRTEVSSLGGRIEVVFQPGQGTRFEMHLPITMALAQVVTVAVGDMRFAVSAASVETLLQLGPVELARAYSERSIEVEGKRLPLYYLATLVDEPSLKPSAQHVSPVMLVRTGTGRIAVHADSVSKAHEVVVKPVGPQVARIGGVAGATVLGNGEILLILNLGQLAREVNDSVQDAAMRAGMEARLEEAPATVMVVDDSVTVRKVTQRLLNRLGYDVVLAKDGVDALRQLQERKPDAMLLDIEMPRMDGFDLTRTLRKDERFADLPIIMITSRTADKHRNHALSLGVDAFLGKPYGEAELTGLLAHHTRVGRG